KGAAAARTSGLDILTSPPESVAFLDSDDTWESGHLDRVAASMRAGADFYFENYHRFDSPTARFGDPDMTSTTCPPFDHARELHWFDGDLFELLLARSPVATSTVAYNFARMPEFRFKPELWFCEDIYFWMQTAAVARKVAFSTKVG